MAPMLYVSIIYNNSIDYRNDSYESLENMNFKYNYSRALIWSKESLSLCRSGGKVLLTEIADLP